MQTTEAAEYFESIVSEFLTSSLKQNADVICNSKRCMKEITKIYMKGLDGTARPDWSDECYRCTYVYRFFARHSSMVYCSLQLALADKKRLTQQWKDKPSFRVCCIGGGPGSDAVGLTKFLRDTQLVPTNRLECSIFDLRQEWENTWKMITRSNSSEVFPKMMYFSGDTTRTDTGLNVFEVGRVRSADVVSFVKFFSTVADSIRKDSRRGNLLREIFRKVKPGALVLYIDNLYGRRHTEFKSIASSGGVTDVLYEQRMPFCLPETKRSEILKRFDKKTKSRVRSRFKLSVMLLRKPLISLHSKADGSEAKSYSDAESDSETKSYSDAESDSETKSYSDAESDSEVKSYSDAESDFEAESYSDAESDSETKSYSDAESDSEVKSYSDAESDFEAESYSDAESDSEAESSSSGRTSPPTKTKVVQPVQRGAPQRWPIRSNRGKPPCRYTPY